jgi:hypothetical protein
MTQQIMPAVMTVLLHKKLSADPAAVRTVTVESVTEI